MGSSYEIVVLSGKGGTGKTSLTAAFAYLAQRAVLTDCDVDAADLHMVVAPTHTQAQEFQAGSKAAILPERCRRCGLCAKLCQFDAISRAEPPGSGWTIDELACEGCGVCAHFCPHDAIEMREAAAGHWYRSETRFGPMLHAQLGVGAENSGKLVTLLRRQARDLALAQGIDLLLTDGPPGIGCPVIASLTGAEHVVYVTEPSISGLHDLERVARLAAAFHVPGSVVINKADIHPDQANEIRRFAQSARLTVLGDVPYDPSFTHAQMTGVSVAELDHGPAAESVRSIWERLRSGLLAQPKQLRLVSASRSEHPTKER